MVKNDQKDFVLMLSIKTQKRKCLMKKGENLYQSIYESCSITFHFFASFGRIARLYGSSLYANAARGL